MIKITLHYNNPQNFSSQKHSFLSKSFLMDLFRNFYLFKGSWIDHFDELSDMLNPTLHQKLSFWEPKDKTKEFTLLILYNSSLTESFCYRRDIWKCDENVFNSFYKGNENNFSIHGYNELPDTLS